LRQDESGDDDDIAAFSGKNNFIEIMTGRRLGGCLQKVLDSSMHDPEQGNNFKEIKKFILRESYGFSLENIFRFFL
jgi:hypothetical protein